MLSIYFLLTIFLLILNKNSRYTYNRKTDCTKIKLQNRKVVIDIFTYHQESTMLSIRLFRMDKYVDCFIVVTSNTTFSGLPLEISFAPFESFINKYERKLILYKITHPKECKITWCREEYQRNKMGDIINSFNLNKESIVIVGDLDEIPTDDAMNYILKKPPYNLYMLKGYMYNYNYRHISDYFNPGTIVVKSKFCNKVQHYRNIRHTLGKRNSIPIYPSQTHCSFCFRNISSIQNKLKSFSHSEYNKLPYTNREYIIFCIKNHLHLTRLNKFKIVKYNKSVTPLPNDKRFNYLKELYGLV